MKIKFLRLFVTAVALLAFPVMNFGQAPNLGIAATYVVFTDTGAFNATASTIIYGDIGSYVGAVNGNPTVYGNKHYGDSTAYKVSVAVDNAYSSLKNDICGTVLGTTLGSAQTLYPGVYCTGAATTLGGNLILDAQGNSSAIFVIKINGAFATGSSANIILKNGASYKNVYWQIGGAVAVGNGSVFMGTIIADGAITFAGSASLTGRALSTSGAITLSNNKMVRDSSLLTGTTSIGAEPSPDTVCLGSSASFFVTSSGTGLTYQWRKGTTKLTNGGDISGATSDTLIINPVAFSDTSSKYNVIISQGGSPIDTSTNVTLLANSVTAATVASQTVCSGSNTVFTVNPTSTGPAKLSYQWQLSTNGGTSFSSITGANAATYTVVAPTGSSDNNQYRSVVSSGSCTAFTSTAGTLRVNTVTAATVASQTVCSGNNALFTAAPTSTGPAILSYQWQLSTNGGTTFSSITGATASAYTVTAPSSSSDNYQYRSVVSSGACASFTSTAGTLRVNAVTSATVAGQTVCSGANAVFTVSPTSTGPAALTYQWLLSINNGTSFASITGATASSYTVSSPTGSSDNYQYEAVVTSTGCSSLTSTAGILRVNSVTAATVAGQIVCSGTNAVFTVSPTSTGSAALTYQWLLSTNSGTSFTSIAGATASSYTVTAPTGSSDSYQYESVVTSTGCSSLTSAAGVLRVNGISAATVANQVVCLGTNAVFTVSPTSTGPATLTYQWQLSTNGGTSFSSISGATASSYTVATPTGSSDNYQYESVVTSTGCSSLTSTAGILRVNSVTAATVAGQIVCSGTNAVFTVSPTSTGPAALTYQWLLSTNNGTSFASITGATASSYTATSPTGSSDNYQYEAVVTSTGCSSLTSTVGVLRVNGVSAATVANQVVCSGANGVFTVSPTSTGPAALTYQWQLSTNSGTSFANISGATASTYTVPTPVSSSDNYQYRTIVSSGACASFISTAGTLRVNAVTAATVAGQIVCSGSDAVFTVSTTSTGSAVLTYQWLISTNNGTSFANISGATASTYTVAAPTSSSDNYQYESVVTSTGCSSLTSTAGVLRVNAITAATVASQTVCSGTNAAFTVSSTSTGPAALTYQWLLSTDGGTTFSNISGATSSSYLVTAPSGSSDNYQYEAVVTSTGCASLTSTIGTLRVNGVSVATVAGQTVCSGNAATFSVSVTNSGPATLSYQWTESTNGGSTFSNISGATSATYTQSAPAASADNFEFECIVTSGSCTSFISTAGVLRVNAVTSATVSNQVVCSGTDATFSVSTTNTGPATLSYQWERSIDGGTTFANISGANGTSYTESAPSASSDNYQYEVIVTSGSCTAFTSTIATLRVNAVTMATVANDTVCSDNNATFSVVVSNSGPASLSYQWQISTDGGTTFSAISGATGSTYIVSAPEAISDNYQYNCIVTSGNCASVTSTTGTLRVNSVTSALIAGQVVCTGNDATFSVLTISAGPGLLTYQWERSTDGGATFANISGSSSASYTVPAPGASSDNYLYECIVTSANCTAFTSNVTNLRVNSITSTPVSGQTVCSGTDAVFNVYPTSSGPASNTYQWQISTDGGSTFADINGANDTIYSVIAPDATSDNYEYRNVMTSGSCTAFTSVAGILRVNDVTSASVAGQSVCSGNNATFTVSEVNSGTGFITYQWKRSIDSGSTFDSIPGATGATFTVTAPTPTSDGYQYESVVTSGSCVSLTSVAGTLSINTAPNITGGLENACVCIFTQASFWVTATGTDLTYQWRRGNVNLVDGALISGANTSVLTVSAVNTPDTGSNYNVIVMGTCSPNDTSSNATLTLCKQSGIVPNNTTDANNAVSFFPNPFTSSISIRINDAKPMNDFQLKIYDALGKEVISANITGETTTLDMGTLPGGVYFYNVIGDNKTIQTGKLVSKQ